MSKWSIAGVRTPVRRPALAVTVVLTLLLEGASAAPSREFHGSRFDETIEAQGRTLELRGLAVKQSTLLSVDVCLGAFYQERPAVDAHPLRVPDRTKAVVLEFLRDIRGSRLGTGLMHELQKHAPEDSVRRAAARLAAQLPDVRKGQRMTYLFLPDRVDLQIDGRHLGTLHGREAHRVVLASFFAERAPRSFREDLLRPLPGGRGSEIGDTLR